MEHHLITLVGETEEWKGIPLRLITPYNVSTLFQLKNPSLLSKCGNVIANKAEQSFSFDPPMESLGSQAPTVFLVQGEPRQLPPDLSKAEIQKQMWMDAKKRLVKELQGTLPPPPVTDLLLPANSNNKAASSAVLPPPQSNALSPPSTAATAASDQRCPRCGNSDIPSSNFQIHVARCRGDNGGAQKVVHDTKTNEEEEAARKKAEDDARQQAARQQAQLAARQAELLAKQREEQAARDAELAAREHAKEVARKKAEDDARQQAARQQAQLAARQAELNARRPPGHSSSTRHPAYSPPSFQTMRRRSPPKPNRRSDDDDEQASLQLALRLQREQEQYYADAQFAASLYQQQLRDQGATDEALAMALQADLDRNPRNPHHHHHHHHQRDDWNFGTGNDGGGYDEGGTRLVGNRPSHGMTDEEYALQLQREWEHEATRDDEHVARRYR